MVSPGASETFYDGGEFKENIAKLDWLCFLEFYNDRSSLAAPNIQWILKSYFIPIDL